ncbi:hypothetical protein LO763_23220 [Glycomyces sp. A-F 0318]|uniref:hypothetical protein n=1 Tax=Glycomyces amatae TaxID=2881355 RepID=UPI001E659ED7|nr:hypothetical protein [Glycomyces amatae]MCD0446532.1 hypothetical protein [Glycomyces amatae]
MIGALWALPAVAVQSYAVATDSGLYARISSAMLLIACFIMVVGTEYRDGEADGETAAAGGRLPLREQLRLAPWGRCAVTYLSATAVAVPVVVAGAYDHQVAFAALSAYLAAGLAVSFIAPLERLVRRVPDTFAAVFTGVPMGLLFGGMVARHRWFDDPWVWTSAALGALMTLRALLPAAAARIRRRRR